MKEIFENKKSKEEWEKNIKNYEYNKKNIIDWSKIKKPELITAEKVKETDIYFNPILQTYNNISLP